MTAPLQDRAVVLSICIPTCNRARYLDNLLNDLRSNIATLQYPCEILIGDNFSEDETPKVVQDHAKHLPIRYFRRPENLGALNNLSSLYESAIGAYCVYLADDDFLMLDRVREIIDFLESNLHVGVVQAPWLNHDRVTGQDFDQFYHLDQNIILERQNFRGLLSLILEKHIFPEIHICRASLLKSIYRASANHAYWAFVQTSVMLNSAAVCFWSRPFYRFVLRYWPDLPHVHAGNEETKNGWDRYRGGLEYILSYFSHQLLVAERRTWLNGIERFTMDRMAVGLRLRTHDQSDWIENYYLANRLLAAGYDSSLVLNYQHYRVNAAVDYLLKWKPHAPKNSTLAYLSSAPPKLLCQASQFNTLGWLVVDDVDQLPEFSVLLTDAALTDHSNKIFTISESQLLSMFP